MNSPYLLSHNQRKNVHNMLSPSRINSFIECPGAWAMRYLYGLKSQASPAMFKGTRIEDWVNHKIEKSEEKDTLVEDDAEEECAQAAYFALKKILGGNKCQMQTKIDVKDRYFVPMIGYIDYYDPKEKHIIDLKTTARIPPRPPASHLRQMVCYSRGVPSKYLTLLYVKTNSSKPKPEIKIYTTNRSLLDQKDSGYDIQEISVFDLMSAGRQIDIATEKMKFHVRVFRASGKCYLPLDMSNYRMNGFDRSLMSEIEGIYKWGAKGSQSLGLNAI